MFNVFFREMHNNRKSIIGWSVGMILLIVSSMAKFSVYQNDSAALSSLLKQLPQSIQTVFGLTGFDLSKPEGFFGVTFLYIALMATVHAGLMGANLIAKEERDRTTEFLFTKPISRTKILVGKMVAGLVAVVLLNIIVMLTSIFSIQAFSAGYEINGIVITSLMGLLLMQLIFLSIGFFIATISRRPKASASIVTSLLLITFIVQYVVDMNKNLDWLKYFTPFKYFDIHLIIQNMNLDIVYITISLIIVLTMTGFSYLSYNRRDLVV